LVENSQLPIDARKNPDASRLPLVTT